MRKRILSCFIIGSMALCVCGCNGQVSAGNNPDNTDLSTEEEQTEPSIFDNIIAGEPINEIKSLFDFTGVLEQNNDYILIAACPYDDNELLAVYSGEEMALVKSFDVSSGVEKLKLELPDIVINDDAVINVVNDDFAYIINSSDSNLIYLDLSDKSYEIIEFDEIPDSIVIMGEGEQFFYTLPDDCNVYQYTRDTGNRISVFDAYGLVDNIEIKYVEEGSNTLIVKVNSDNYSGYASLTIELQELSPLEEMTGELLYSGNEYVYTAPDKDATIVIYNPMTPRLLREFYLENTEELRNIRLFSDTPYVITKVETDKETVIRLYNIDEGIMENILTLDVLQNISDIKFYSSTNNVMLKVDDTLGSRILIWNTEIIDKILE